VALLQQFPTSIGFVMSGWCCTWPRPGW